MEKQMACDKNLFKYRWRYEEIYQVFLNNFGGMPAVIVPYRKAIIDDHKKNSDVDSIVEFTIRHFGFFLTTLKPIPAIVL